MTNADEEKQAAAEAAVTLIGDRMRVGLGTGTTVAHLLPLLPGHAREVTYIASSPPTETPSSDPARTTPLRSRINPPRTRPVRAALASAKPRRWTYRRLPRPDRQPRHTRGPTLRHARPNRARALPTGPRRRDPRCRRIRRRATYPLIAHPQARAQCVCVIEPGAAFGFNAAGQPPSLCSCLSAAA
jgi:hypothetical protein